MKKIIILTGASGNLGNAICSLLRQENYSSIVSIGRTKPENVDIHINLDLCDLKSTTILKNAIISEVELNKYDQIDFIHVAGMYQQYKLPLNLEEEQAFLNFFQLHCNSFFLIINFLFDYWKQKKEGNIIAVSSNLVTRVKGNTLFYTATKGCLNIMVKQLASDLGRIGIRCNAVAPGYFCDQHENKLIKSAEKIIMNTPLSRLATAQDISKVIVMLLRNDAYWITGEIIKVDGGNANEFGK